MEDELLDEILSAGGEDRELAADGSPNNNALSAARGNNSRKRGPARAAHPSKMLDPTLHWFEMFPNGHPRFLTKASRLKIMRAQLQNASTMGYFEAGSLQPTRRVNASEHDVADVESALGWNAYQQGRSRSAAKAAIRRNPESSASLLLESCKALPEPVWDLGIEDTSAVVTLRVRCIGKKGKSLPDFAEGDMVTGIEARRRANKKGRGQDRSDNDDDDDYDEDDEFNVGGGSDHEEVPGDANDDDSRLRPRRAKRKKEAISRVYRILAVFWGTRAYVSMMVDRDSKPVLRTRSEGHNCFLVCSLVKAG